MEYRKRSTITIYRDNEELVSVPITKDCKRIFKLMKEDCIKLVFVLTEAKELCINDYIDDEIFGRFYIAKKQTGTWNPQDGVYKYDITFVAEYMLWANYEYMYTSKPILCIGAKKGDLIREETDWHFTANLEQHLEMIIANLQVLGYKYDYTIHRDPIDPYIDNVYRNYVSDEKKVTYQHNQSKNIIDALNKIVEDYECEWWVENKTIHIGKCLYGNEISIESQKHLANFSIKDNRKDYCNVIRAYGGDKNIPASYRKNLYLFIDYSFTTGGVTYWIDSSKKLSADFFQGYNEDFYLYTSKFVKAKYTISEEQYKSEGVWHKSLAKAGIYTLNLPSAIVYAPAFHIKSFSGKSRKAVGVVTAVIEFYDNTSIVLKEWTGKEITCDTPYVDLDALGPIIIGNENFDVEIKRGMMFRLSFYYRCDMTLFLTPAETLEGVPDEYAFDMSEVMCKSSNSGKSMIDVTYYDEGEYIDTQINISTLNYTRPDNFDVVRYGLTTKYGETHENVLKKGRILLVHTDDNVDIPQAYYLDSLDDPSNIARVGSKRLRLPQYYTNRLSYIYNMPTNGVVADTKLEWVYTHEFAEEIRLIEIIKGGIGKRVFVTLPVSDDKIEWEKFKKPINKIDKETPNYFKAGYYVLRDLSVGDTIEFGNRLYDGIVNMIRWVVLDKNGNVVDYSRECDSEKEKYYIVGKDCYEILCSHYHYFWEEPYIKILKALDMRTSVERTILFDDVYPKLHLYVKDIETTARTDKESFEGENEETKEWNWNEYTITLQTHDGVAFNDFRFKNKYILQDEKLQIQFLYPGALEGLENTGSPCKLAGMIFDVQHINDGEVSKFKILRNEDFGAKFPSDLLCPSSKDPCTLIGWNIKAVQSTGIIEAAEKKLYNLAKEYKDAMEDNPYTFECTLFSHYMLENLYECQLADANGKDIVGADGKYIIVKNKMLFKQGQKIKIVDPTLHNKECKSRVIGYEYKLDIPWDSPKITVGETDAYSRLAKIEKEIKSS